VFYGSLYALEEVDYGFMNNQTFCYNFFTRQKWEKAYGYDFCLNGGIGIPPFRFTGDLA
jgi:hypothetical protein